MKNKQLAKQLTALGLLLGLTAGTAHAAPLSGTPADPGVINRDQVLYWLIKRGEINADASEQAKKDAVDAFVLRASNNPPKSASIELSYEKRRLAQLSKDKANKHSRSTPYAIADADVTKTVKVLGVLIDFPDLPYDNNRLTASDTGMYYPSYPTSHYRDLLFSTTGFKGPQGQNLTTAYQYFQEVSGQTFSFTGDVKGWFRADNNAAYYGGNLDDSDKAVEELVKEAVTKAIAGMTTAEIAAYDIEDQYDRDGDGILDEPDGVIDHVMIFHSSIGEEAGGGVLGDDAIWSHRYFVASEPVSIPGTSKKLHGYTIQPIDAAAGVCTHEFGHDLGLPDEYDTTNEGDGSPVGSWSLMSGGSWSGWIPGSRPSGFSPYARSYLQERYKGKWVNEQVISLDSLNASGTDFVINQAVEHNNVNQLSIPLPAEDLVFKLPYQGQYQYYSGSGNMLNNAMAFDVSLPSATPLTLTMQAHWNIELDYDYMQLQVDGTAIAGNHTKASNNINTARNIITGNSADVVGATSPDNWVTLEYDLSAYAGRTVRISSIYKTDEAVGDYGMAIDNIAIRQGATEVYSDDAEAAAKAQLSGFSRITSTRPGEARRYIIQLRSYNGVDIGLQSDKYEPGVLVWLENFNYSDNNVSSHAGAGLIGVIDADQNMINTASTDVQIRDAAFSTVAQKAYSGDAHLDAVSLFDDSLDYMAPMQPQSGMIIPRLGLTMEVKSQASTNTTAIITLRKTDGSIPTPVALDAEITANISGYQVSFNANATGGDGNYRYAWSFGVTGETSTVAAPSYTYSSSGSYTVTLEVTDGTGDKITRSKTVTVAPATAPLTATIVTNMVGTRVDFSTTLTNGVGPYTYEWDFGVANATSTLAAPSFTYTESGIFTVTLAVVDSKGNRATSQQSVSIVIAPKAFFSASVNKLTVTFTNGSSGGVGALSYAWNFGDGQTSTLASPSHTYTQAGSYSVSLVTTDTKGSTSSYSTTVTVSAPKTETDSSSGGGSLGWLSIALLALIGVRRQLTA